MDVREIQIKQISIRLIKNWKFLTAFLIILIIANLWIVKEVMVDSTYNIQQIPILKTYKATGNCFYQKKYSPKWQFLSGEEILGTNTQIQTDADSHVILSFLGATGKLEVSERTELGIYKNAQETSIDFKKGELFINYQAQSPKEYLIVKIGKKSFQLSNSDLYIFGDANSQVAVSVDYGKATMTVGDRTNTFEKGQMAFFKNDREYSVEESPFRVQTPLNYDRYSLDDEDYSVRFAYAPFPKEYYIQLLLGSTVFDMKPHFAKPQLFKSNEFSLNFPHGSYYWRLVAYDKPNGTPQFYSHTKRFFVEPKIRIQPVMPIVNAKYIMQSGKAQVRFQWDNPSQLEKSFIEISDQKKFDHVLVHESTAENNFFVYDFTKPGEYYWRVSGFPFGSSDLIVGTFRRIEIVNQDAPQSLKLTFPRDKIFLTTLSLKNSDIHFQWTKSFSTKSYSVEIESLSKKNKYEYLVDDNSIKVTDLPEGSYRWRVVDKDNPKIKSDYEDFTVIKTAKLEFKSQDEHPDLKWEKGPSGTLSYRVEALKIGSRSNLNEFFYKNSQQKKRFETKTEQIKYNQLPEGVYAFKVYALDKQKNILADSDLKFLKVK